jgi:hypothetical protein
MIVIKIFIKYWKLELEYTKKRQKALRCKIPCRKFLRMNPEGWERGYAPPVIHTKKTGLLQAGFFYS